MAKIKISWIPVSVNLCKLLGRMIFSQMSTSNLKHAENFGKNVSLHGGQQLLAFMHTPHISVSYFRSFERLNQVQVLITRQSWLTGVYLLHLNGH